MRWEICKVGDMRCYMRTTQVSTRDPVGPPGVPGPSSCHAQAAVRCGCWKYGLTCNYLLSYRTGICYLYLILYQDLQRERPDQQCAVRSVED